MSFHVSNSALEVKGFFEFPGLVDSRSSRQHIAALRDIEKLENLPLKWCELGLKNLNDLAVFQQRVARNGAEELGDAPRGRSATRAIFGVERQFVEALLLHLKTRLAFDERLDQEGVETEAEERLNARLILEEYQRNRVDRLQLSLGR